MVRFLIFSLLEEVSLVDLNHHFPIISFFAFRMCAVSLGFRYPIRFRYLGSFFCLRPPPSPPRIPRISSAFPSGPLFRCKPASSDLVGPRSPLPKTTLLSPFNLDLVPSLSLFPFSTSRTVLDDAPFKSSSILRVCYPASNDMASSNSPNPLFLFS